MEKIFWRYMRDGSCECDAPQKRKLIAVREYGHAQKRVQNMTCMYCFLKAFAYNGAYRVYAELDNQSPHSIVVEDLHGKVSHIDFEGVSMPVAAFVHLFHAITNPCCQ